MRIDNQRRDEDLLPVRMRKCEAGDGGFSVDFLKAKQQEEKERSLAELLSEGEWVAWVSRSGEASIVSGEGEGGAGIVAGEGKEVATGMDGDDKLVVLILGIQKIYTPNLPL